VVEPPEDVLKCVRAPAEVGGVPAEEVLLPVGQIFGVGGVAGAPAAGNGVALDIHVNFALRALGEELLVRGQRVLVGARRRLVGRSGRDRPAARAVAARAAATLRGEQLAELRLLRIAQCRAGVLCEAGVERGETALRVSYARLRGSDGVEQRSDGGGLRLAET
jgi:hypothetical protein